jgi:hypothetical protein
MILSPSIFFIKLKGINRERIIGAFPSLATMSHEFIIPIYLDTSALLDILASMEDGFSMSNNVTTYSSNSKNTQVSGNAEFGIPFLNFFPIRFGGSGKKAKDSESSEERISERKYTYGSLLNKLRTSLNERKLLTQIQDQRSWEQVNYSDFVEVTGTFIRSPVLNMLLSKEGVYHFLLEIRKIEKMFNESGQSNDTQIRNLELGIDINKWLRKKVETKRSQIYVVELSQPKDHKVVVSLFTDFLRDRIGNELPNGHFRMLGKVMRKVSGDESLDLLEKSSLNAIDDNEIDRLFQDLTQIQKKGVKLPPWYRHVKAPAMVLIPIAVYI